MIDVLGTDDRKIIEKALTEYVGNHFNSSYEILSIEASVGVVIIIQAEDKKFLLKCFSRGTGQLHLNEVHRLMKLLYEMSYPLPKPMVAAEPFLKGYIICQEYVSKGVPEDSHNSQYRKLMAKYLYELHNGLDNKTSLKRRSMPRKLYEEPHNVLFDLHKDKSADWIDEKALACRAVIDETIGEDVISHTDWSNKHFRFINNDVSVIYDWDSLARINELHVLGIAAATFTITWDIQVKEYPTPDESKAFIEDYEKYKGKKFTESELAQISAYTGYYLCYIARCISSVDRKRLYSDGIIDCIDSINLGKYF